MLFDMDKSFINFVDKVTGSERLPHIFGGVMFCISLVLALHVAPELLLLEAVGLAVLFMLLLTLLLVLILEVFSPLVLIVGIPVLWVFWLFDRLVLSRVRSRIRARNAEYFISSHKEKNPFSDLFCCLIYRLIVDKKPEVTRKKPKDRWGLLS